jgi:hypothetical protein
MNKPCLLFVLALTLSLQARAEDARVNHGDDPFMHVSSAIADCPAPRGPFDTEEEWLKDAHYRIEDGNNCWVEGRCRLSSSYRYDKEIAESVTRRLDALNASTQWREKTSLWLTIQKRFIYIDGCVSRDFDLKHFVSAIGQTADVERVLNRAAVKP